MRIDMAEIGGASILAQAVAGRAAFRKLLEITESDPAMPEPAYLDFGDVQVATASFLRETVLAFRDAARGRHSNLYPIVANANDAVREELLALLQSRGDALMTCQLSHFGQVTDADLLGDLDPKQKLTFELVCKHRDVDAGELMRLHGDGDNVQRTAWNNRLSALAGMGLIVETSQGRAKRYKPLLVEP
jgi:hypothetical protein